MAVTYTKFDELSEQDKEILKNGKWFEIEDQAVKGNGIDFILKKIAEVGKPYDHPGILGPVALHCRDEESQMLAYNTKNWMLIDDILESGYKDEINGFKLSNKFLTTIASNEESHPAHLHAIAEECYDPEILIILMNNPSFLYSPYYNKCYKKLWKIGGEKYTNQLISKPNEFSKETKIKTQLFIDETTKIMGELSKILSSSQDEKLIQMNKVCQEIRDFCLLKVVYGLDVDLNNMNADPVKVAYKNICKNVPGSNRDLKELYEDVLYDHSIQFIDPKIAGLLNDYSYCCGEFGEFKF